jgi:phage tail sheath gpL-like
VIAPVVTFTGSAAGDGTLSIYSGGALIHLPVAAGESGAIVMAKAAAAINAARFTEPARDEAVLNRAARRRPRRAH